MNKKFTLLAAALMTVGTFTAASAASDDWTVGNYYYLKSGNKYLSLDGNKADSVVVYNPQNEMFRLLGTKRSFSQNETFFFSHP